MIRISSGRPLDEEWYSSSQNYRLIPFVTNDTTQIYETNVLLPKIQFNSVHTFTRPLQVRWREVLSFDIFLRVLSPVVVVINIVPRPYS